MKFNNKPLIILLLILTTSYSLIAQNRQEVVTFQDAYKRNYNATAITNERPKIDGQLDENLWINQGEWSEHFSQVIPFERVFTPSKTKMKIFYDQENIYIGVYCKDAYPDKMNAFIGNRDDNSNGDLISIAFDPYHDYRAAVEFNLNLGGNKTDLTVTDKLSVNLSWNAVWEGKTHINKSDSSWTAEIRIPFSQIRYNQDNDDGIWGLHVRRIIRRNNEVQNWSLIPIKNNGHVFSFGEMRGMNNLPKPRGIELLPYVMTKHLREPKIQNSPFQTGKHTSLNIGLDAKMALKDYTLDLTINPDYGQVELDPSVMNLTAYEVYYDEKRPFFLEGKHILEFDNNGDGMMFYSRRIGSSPSYRPEGIDNISNFASSNSNIPILGAMKVTGTNKNGLTIGLLESITAQTSAKVQRNGIRSKEITEPLTNFTVARVQKNWEGNTLLGGMVTSTNRKLNDAHLKNNLIENAWTGGIDFTKYFNNRLYYIDAKGMFSTLHGTAESVMNIKQNATHYYQRESAVDYLKMNPDAKQLNGTGGFVKVGKRGNAQWNFSETFSWASPGFDMNDVGFTRLSDFKLNESEITYRKTDPWGLFRFAGINLTQKNVWNYGGTALNNDFAVRWRSLSIKKRFEMDIKETFNWNTVDTRRLRGGPDLRYTENLETALSLNTDRAQKVMLRFEYFGRQYLAETSFYNEIRPAAIFRIGNHLKLTTQFNYAWNKDNLQYVATVPLVSNGMTSPNKPLYIMGRMNQQTYGITINAQYNVTPDLSIQYYGSPFTSIADFNNFKIAKNTLDRKYSHRFEPIQNSSLVLKDGIYSSATNSQLEFKNPNFSFNEIRSNLVIRWEYLPGSTAYLVWEHNRSNRQGTYYSGWGNNLDYMFSLPANNTIMLKVNYWLGL